jgi:hypothetical protein
MSYASGVYTSKARSGRSRTSRNPLLRKTGIVTGPGHGRGKGRTALRVHTIVMSIPGGGAFGMDPVGFDAQGSMYVRVRRNPTVGARCRGQSVRDGDSSSC